jgi:hypothetical protein
MSPLKRKLRLCGLVGWPWLNSGSARRNEWHPKLTEISGRHEPKHPSGPPMMLGNMRELGVHHLIASLSMNKTELVIQLLKVAIGIAFAAYFFWSSLAVRVG